LGLGLGEEKWGNGLINIQCPLHLVLCSLAFFPLVKKWYCS